MTEQPELDIVEHAIAGTMLLGSFLVLLPVNTVLWLAFMLGANLIYDPPTIVSFTYVMLGTFGIGELLTFISPYVFRKLSTFR